MNNQQIKQIDDFFKSSTEAKNPTLSLDDINHHRNVDVEAKKRKSKNKAKFSLYEVYKDVKVSLSQAEILLNEFVRLENDVAVINETGEAFCKISEDAKENLEQAIEIYNNVRLAPDAIKADWIKRKVMTNRYTARGFEVVNELQNVGDAIFGLNTICVTIQTILIKNDEEYYQKTGEAQ